MFKKILMILIMVIFIIPISFAGLEPADMAIGIKTTADINWLYHIASTSYSYLSGYSATWAINVDVDKTNYGNNPFIDYAYLEEYEWYKPGFTNKYERDESPILISSCLVVSESPDYPLVPIIWNPVENSDFLEQEFPSASLEMWIDLKRDFSAFKSYKDDGGTYSCWDGGFTTYCYLYLDQDYMDNPAVVDYYDWDEDNPPNLKDVANIDLFNNCDEDSEGSYCMVNINYPWFLTTTVSTTACTDNSYFLSTEGVGLWNATSAEFNEIEDADANLNISGVDINNEPSDSGEADDASGGGGGIGEENIAGYQYTKVRGYIIETEIATQQMNYLSTILNIMKILFSFLLLIFYIIEFSVIIYVPTELVPNMFEKMLDIIKKAGRFK